MIYTGYYAKIKKYKEFGIEPIAISGKVPDFYNGLTYPDFAPRYSAFQMWKDEEITNEKYIELYRTHLDTVIKGIIRTDFEPYSKEGKDCVLLCYEKSGDFCHRHILADWLRENFGFEVREF